MVHKAIGLMEMESPVKPHKLSYKVSYIVFISTLVYRVAH